MYAYLYGCNINTYIHAHFDTIVQYCTYIWTHMSCQYDLIWGVHTYVCVCWFVAQLLIPNRATRRHSIDNGLWVSNTSMYIHTDWKSCMYRDCVGVFSLMPLVRGLDESKKHRSSGCNAERERHHVHVYPTSVYTSCILHHAACWLKPISNIEHKYTYLHHKRMSQHMMVFLVFCFWLVCCFCLALVFSVVRVSFSIR